MPHFWGNEGKTVSFFRVTVFKVFVFKFLEVITTSTTFAGSPDGWVLDRCWEAIFSGRGPGCEPGRELHQKWCSGEKTVSFWGVTVFKSSVFKFLDIVTRSTTVLGSPLGASGEMGGAAADWWWRFVMRNLSFVVRDL